MMSARSSVCPQCGNNFLHGDCGHRNIAYWAGISDAELAVIEAAKEWRDAADEEMRYLMSQTDVGINPHLLDLFEAIEALEAAEKAE